MGAPHYAFAHHQGGDPPDLCALAGICRLADERRTRIVADGLFGGILFGVE
jgi:hypothetical protein